MFEESAFRAFRRVEDMSRGREIGEDRVRSEGKGEGREELTLQPP
jgi:hypothetical protein